MQPHFTHIYVQQAIDQQPAWRRRADAILARFPTAEVVPVPSHWQIPDLFAANPQQWTRTKRERLVLGVKSGLRHTKNGRSADFIAASSSNGCISACQYCYVARHKGGSNPLTVFVNLDEIIDSIRQHQAKLGRKPAPNMCDPEFWTYDIGCNADLSQDALVCDHPGELINAFAAMPYAKATFATKTVYESYWTQFTPNRRCRIRYSVMPQPIARLVDIGTSPISERIQSVNSLVQGGYEVHLNFSPIILYGGDQWRHDWVTLWQEIDATLSAEAKAQLQCEVFFLTHSQRLHEQNLQWNAKTEALLWTPEWQVPKRTDPTCVVYDYAMRRTELARFQHGLQEYLPYCRVRYAF